MIRFGLRGAIRILALAGLLAGWVPSAIGADSRLDVPIGPAVQPHLSEGHPPDLTPPVTMPDKMPVKYECPRIKYINCMPPIAGEAKSLCAPEYLEWVKGHCPGVEVVY